MYLLALVKLTSQHAGIGTDDVRYGSSTDWALHCFALHLEATCYTGGHVTAVVDD